MPECANAKKNDPNYKEYDQNPWSTHTIYEKLYKKI